MILRAMDRKLWNWFNTHLPVLEVEDSCGLVALSDKGIPMAGCVFDNFTHTSVQVHLLIVNALALRSGFYEVCGDFVFKDQGKRLVYGMVPSDNEKALKFNRRKGWREVFRLKEGFKEGVDYVIMELTKEVYESKLSEEAKRWERKAQTRLT